MPPPSPQQNQGDNSMSAMWIIIGIFVAIYFLWIGLREYIVMFVLKLKLFELSIIGLFTSDGYAARFIAPAKEQIFIMAANAKQVEFQHLIDLSVYVGDFMKIPVAMLLLALAYVSYQSDLTLSFKKVYSMKSLGDEEKINYPQITPTMHLNLVKIHVNEGPWAMSLTPMMFAKKHDLVEVLPDIPEKERGQNIRIRKGMASQIFSLQLGKLWSGLDGLSDMELALFGVFAARVNHDQGPAAAMLKQINVSSGKDKLNFSGARQLADKYFNTKAVQEVVARHAYQMTVFTTLLSLARSDGILPTADFLWLKIRDRELWFALNGVGRQTPVVEVAGIYAHWFAELELKRKLYVPMIDEATTALQVAVEEMIYKLDEDTE